MKGRRGFTLIELLVVIAIIAILAAILFPVFARVRKTALNSDCQSNLKQISSAFKMYLGEWHDCYPYQDTTNGKSMVLLTPPSTPPNADGTPKRYTNGGSVQVQAGVNWVESLFPYVEWITTTSAGAWACKAASDKGDMSISPTYGSTAKVTYVMNANLVAQPEGIIKTSSNMLLCRETDRRMHSCLRPSNVSTDQTTIPKAPFLSATDAAMGMGSDPGPLNFKPHNMGSNVLFSDGHVKNFSSDAMPDSLTTANYDSKYGDAQWFNSVDTGPKSLWKAIAITP